MQQEPLLTIGLVVRNGEKHLAQAIDSFLAQTFQDFELVIYDNASTDSTPHIAQQYAARDSRVRWVRHETNLGALRNFIIAAEAARTPLFCWAAHDDLREPDFLGTLVDLLHAQPNADLACCAVRNIDPDGRLRELRPETNSLSTSEHMSQVRRLLMYLREMPGTPMYGVFRTAALQRSLAPLHAAAEDATAAPMLGIDMVFLASFLRTHGLAVTHEPLLLFRRGGMSHRIDQHETIWVLVRQIARFHACVARAVHDPKQTFIESLSLSIARWRFIAIYLSGRPMRRMIWHCLSRPRWMRWLQARWMVMTNPAFVRLRRRVRMLPAGSRIVLFGGGKHTQRCLEAIRLALGPNVHVHAVCDDAPSHCKLPAEVVIISPDQLRTLGPAIILISSDTYEQQLFDRARSVALSSTAIWCIYDMAIEEQMPDRSARSTPSMNCSSSVSESEASERELEPVS